MTMTEEQAREKWCPYARSYSFEEFQFNTAMASTNREPDGAPNKACRCIASDCMAWRWKVGPPTKLEKAEYDETNIVSEQRGFCGPAGAPQ